MKLTGTNNNKNENRIKVMWLSINPSLFDIEKTARCWTYSLEKVLKDHYGKEIELAVVFENSSIRNRWCYERKYKKTIIDDTSYYQISKRNNAPNKGIRRPDAFAKWEYIKPEILSVIEDFRPDVIQCFGSEWPYGMITESVNVPVIIHMQGFLNIYRLSGKMIPCDKNFKTVIRLLTPDKVISYLRPRSETEVELKIMAINRYFMGRTEWDRSIVKHYSPEANYYYVPEAIRPEILESASRWKDRLRISDKTTLLTVSSASVLKGNDIILQTARIMKDFLGMDFEWRVTGDKKNFMRNAKRVGIDPERNNIKLLGFINAEQIADELIEADIFIHPSIIDNSPNAICEAQIIGCPVIASDVGGVKSIVEDGVTGYLYPYNEPHTLAFMIADLLQTPEIMERLSEKETETASQRHDPKTVANYVYRTYLDVINDYRQGSRMRD